MIHQSIALLLNLLVGFSLASCGELPFDETQGDLVVAGTSSLNLTNKKNQSVNIPSGTYKALARIDNDFYWPFQKLSINLFVLNEVFPFSVPSDHSFDTIEGGGYRFFVDADKVAQNYDLQGEVTSISDETIFEKSTPRETVNCYKKRSRCERNLSTCLRHYRWEYDRYLRCRWGFPPKERSCFEPMNRCDLKYDCDYGCTGISRREIVRGVLIDLLSPGSNSSQASFYGTFSVISETPY